MTHIPTTKLLRISTFLAVSAGLAIGSQAIAATPEAEPSSEIAQADEAQDDDPGLMPGEEADEEAEEDIDYPAAIEDFEEFVREHEQHEQIEDAHEFTHEGAEHMADAMNEVLPQEDEWFEEEPEEFQQLEDQLEAFEDRVDELADEDREDYSQLVQDVFNDGAEWLTSVEEAIDTEAQATQVQTHAGEIQPGIDVDQQLDQIHTYFDTSVNTIKELYEAQEEEEPLAAEPTVELAPIAGDDVVAQDRRDAPADEHEDPADERDDDDGIFDFDEEEAEVPGAVEDFNEFVENHREEGIDHVADYTREGAQHYHDALQEFVEDDQELLQRQLDDFQESVDELDETPRAQYPQQLVDTLNEGGQIMMVVQQMHYPETQYEEQVSNALNAVDQIETTEAIEEQVSIIENAFDEAANSLETMAMATDEVPPEVDPEARKSAEVILAGGEHTQREGDQPDHEQPGIEGPDIEEQPDQPEPDVEMTEAVRDYVEGVEQADAEEFTGMQGEQNVVDYMRDLEGALATFVEDEQPADEMEQPGARLGDTVEFADYGNGGMEHEEDPMDQPGVEDEADELTEQYEQLQQDIDELEEHVGQDEFVEMMQEAMETSADTIAAIEEEHELEADEPIEGVEYRDEPEMEEPGVEEEPEVEEGEHAEMIRQLAQQIDPEASLDEQNEQVLEYFEQTAEVVQTLDEQRHEMPEEDADDEPLTLLGL